MNRRSLVFAGLSACALGASAALRPSKRAAETLEKIDLEAQVPKAFAGWIQDTSIVPVLPNPEIQAKLDAIYTQVLARTYRRDDGVRILFTIAYGADQATDATSVHRPEFCYSAQGFAVRPIGDSFIQLGSKRLEVRRLEGRLGQRYEPITYWVTLNDRSVLPGVSRKIEQLRLGLGGIIPDGMLVRISTINIELQHAVEIHDRFALDLESAINTNIRDRYFGA